MRSQALEEAAKLCDEAGDYFLADDIRALSPLPVQADEREQELKKQLRFAVENLEGIRDGTDCVSSVIIRKSRALLALSPLPAPDAG